MGKGGDFTVLNGNVHEIGVLGGNYRVGFTAFDDCGLTSPSGQECRHLRISIVGEMTYSLIKAITKRRVARLRVSLQSAGPEPWANHQIITPAKNAVVTNALQARRQRYRLCGAVSNLPARGSIDRGVSNIARVKPVQRQTVRVDDSTLPPKR